MTLTSPNVPELVVLGGPRAGRSYALPYGDYLLGRGGRSRVRIDHDDVSREHARVEVGPDGVVVHDLGSKNGVWVAGQRLRGPTPLQHDDSFSLGDLTLRIVHPASQVTRALARGGETTVTTHLRPPLEPEPEPGVLTLALPLVGVLVFGVLVVVMLLQ